MKVKFIGEVAVDSGQLLLCDPCYIDSEWEKEDFEDIRVYENTLTKERLQYKIDFPKYDVVIPEYGKSMNELLKTEDWVQVHDAKEAENPFSYNACAKATLSEHGHGELRFKLGHPGAGVAFSTAFGDGMYPVYAKYSNDGTLQSVEVIFSEDDY